jgi:hypothetical protein
MALLRDHGRIAIMHQGLTMNIMEVLIITAVSDTVITVTVIADGNAEDLHSKIFESCYVL